MEWKDLEGGGLVVPDQGGPHDQVPTTTIATIGSLGPNPSGGKGFPSEKNISQATLETLDAQT